MINEKNSDLCWIYILEDESQLIYIGLTGDIKQRMDDYQNHKIKMIERISPKLVYYRHFPDTLSAIGFKLLLHKLSSDSVDYLIRQMNPEKNNLITHIF